jgi:hypothetical protein
MSFYTLDLIELFTLKVMNPYVAVPVTTSNLLAIVGYSQASDRLLNVLGLSEHDFIHVVFVFK